MDRRNHTNQRPRLTPSIDLMGPLPTGCGGMQYILAVLDTSSKYIRLYALKKATTKGILNRLEHDYITTTGKSKSVLTVNGGTQFTSKLWKKKMDELSIIIKHYKIPSTI